MVVGSHGNSEPRQLMSEQTFELSRRNALLGIGTIGVASAGAGLGTSAFFSDQEEFTDNTIEAGEFALSVDPFVEGIDQDGIGPDEVVFDDPDDSLLAEGAFELEDAKPGDEYEFGYEIEVNYNPGLVKIVVGELVDQDGAEAGNISVDDLWDIDDEDDLSTVGEESEATLTVVDEAGDVIEEVATDEPLADLLEDLEDDGIVVESGEDEDGEGEACHAVGTPVEARLDIVIPEDVGNEIQGAEIQFDLVVYAEQCRHNDVEDFEEVEP